MKYSSELILFIRFKLSDYVEKAIVEFTNNIIIAKSSPAFLLPLGGG